MSWTPTGMMRVAGRPRRASRRFAGISTIARSIFGVRNSSCRGATIRIRSKTGIERVAISNGLISMEDGKFGSHNQGVKACLYGRSVKCHTE